jgi:hypothetical protein
MSFIHKNISTLRNIGRVIALAASLICTSAAWAEDAQDCSLKQIASLPITTTASGKIAVPVKIDGTERLFAVRFGGDVSGVSAEFAAKANMDVSRINKDWLRNFADDYFTDGETETLEHKVKIPDFQIGALDAKDLEVGELPSLPSSAGVIGVLGTGVLQHFDVEFDFQNEKMNLYAPRKCDAAPVYWANAFAVLPFERNDVTGEISSPLTLDGKTLQVAFSTDPGHGQMSVFVATNLLGIAISDPNLKEVGVQAGSDLQIYHYPFKSLSLNGIAIQDPEIDLITDRPATDSGDCTDIKFRGGWQAGSGWEKEAKLMCATDLTIKLDELEKLHLYFAFGQNKLYVTAADALK